jgi:hypothetical protein
VTVGDLYDGLCLFGDTKKPHRSTGEASSSGAPSGTRTPDPLIKSPGPIRVDFVARRRIEEAA